MPDARSRPDRPPAERLPLGQASRLLGVDPDTLRRWADEGRVPAFTTPGGHRRFERRALERLVAARRTGGPGALAGVGDTTGRLTAAYRRRYGELHGEGADIALDRPASRSATRSARRGGSLVEALVRHLDGAGTDRVGGRAPRPSSSPRCSASGSRDHGIPLETASRCSSPRASRSSRSCGCGRAPRGRRRRRDRPALRRVDGPAGPAAARLRRRAREPERRGRPPSSRREPPDERAAARPLTSVLAAACSRVMLLDQWRERRHGFQLVWAFGMLCYALGAGAEAIAAANGWNEPLTARGT